jgi:hypothetical protein
MLTAAIATVLVHLELMLPNQLKNANPANLPVWNVPIVLLTAKSVSLTCSHIAEYAQNHVLWGLGFQDRHACPVNFLA